MFPSGRSDGVMQWNEISSMMYRVTYLGKSKTLPHLCSLVSNNMRRLTLLDTLELFMGPYYSENTTPAMELIIRDLRLPNLRHCLLGVGDPDRSRFSFICKWHVNKYPCCVTR